MSAQQVVKALAAISATEWIAVAFALAYLVLAVRQNTWCWLFAAVSSALYFWLFAAARLPMQAALQLFYIAMAGYGWYAWHRGRGEAASAVERAAGDRELRTRAEPGDRALAVARWPLRRHVVALVAVLVVTGLNVTLLRDASLVGGASAERWVAFLDAGIAWSSVLTTWMVARKVLENWLYWIVLDLAAAWLYGLQGLYATAALFVLYAVIAARGYQSWRASLSDEPRSPLHDAR